MTNIAARIRSFVESARTNVYPKTAWQVILYIQKAEPVKSKGVRLAHSGGTWYFYGGIADKFHEQSVGVLRINHLQLERWLETFRLKCEDVDKRSW